MPPAPPAFVADGLDRLEVAVAHVALALLVELAARDGFGDKVLHAAAAGVPCCADAAHVGWGWCCGSGGCLAANGINLTVGRMLDLCVIVESGGWGD